MKSRRIEFKISFSINWDEMDIILVSNTQLIFKIIALWRLDSEYISNISIHICCWWDGIAGFLRFLHILNFIFFSSKIDFNKRICAKFSYLRYWFNLCVSSLDLAIFDLSQSRKHKLLFVFGHFHFVFCFYAKRVKT